MQASVCSSTPYESAPGQCAVLSEKQYRCLIRLHEEPYDKQTVHAVHSLHPADKPTKMRLTCISMCVWPASCYSSFTFYPLLWISSKLLNWFLNWRQNGDKQNGNHFFLYVHVDAYSSLNDLYFSSISIDGAPCKGLKLSFLSRNKSLKLYILL